MEKKKDELLYDDIIYDNTEKCYIVSPNKSKRNYMKSITTLLNQQSARIKELECQVEKWKQDYENCSKLEKNLTKEHQYCLDNWRACEQENQQLKEEIKDIKNNYRSL